MVPLTPLTGGNAPMAGAILLIALVAGVFAGLTQKGRYGLLLSGLVLIAAFGVVTLVSGGGLAVAGPREVLVGQLVRLYDTVIPLVVAFLAGFLAARGSWWWRGGVVLVGVLLVVMLPFPVMAESTADGLLTP